MTKLEIGDEVYVRFGDYLFKMMVIELGKTLITLQRGDTSMTTPRTNLVDVVDPSQRIVTISDFLD
jgi:hypothetical protein